MAQVKLSATELIAISTLIEDAARNGKQESEKGLYIDFMYMPASMCKALANILQHISTELYGFTDREKELCDKLMKATK